MTDEQLDRMVRDADPYRPEAVRHLDGAAQHLLEEIMSTPTLAPATEPPQPRPARRGLVSGLAAAGVAAVLLTGFVAASALRPAPPAGHQASPVTTSKGTQQVAYSAMALKAAEQNPRLLIDQPGWKATTVYGFAEKHGTIGFTNGDRQVEMNWYPAEYHQGYYKDRLNVSRPEKVTVDGQPADLFRYAGNDFAVITRPRDGSFVELRGGGMRRAEFDRMLAAVVRVDVRTWLAAMPPEIVTPDRIKERAATVLADVPLPPGFDAAALSELGVNDSYQFGAQVVARVGCGWIEEWLRARKAGDDAAAKRAVDALRSSHKWKVLHDMNDAGDYPEVFWEYADKVTAGDKPAGYRDALGCV
ncbi:hypothetical protein [Micromonospora siamensis]|uniref:Uncharacterized protein n=1 Tax=Micromonospora siamensis TaxID=299152 RepID=A0A1C5HKB8_9ACTN|nr:hypothetical protein [Micromonospora siamensis]SCG46327.1 hypothetical protein GA0074704_1872 [Micromonospora siamensis]